LGIAASLELPSLIMTSAFGSVSWHFAPDGTVIAAATAVVLLTCVAFGLAPSLHATTNDVASVLKTGDAASQAASGRRLRGTLLSLQVAVSLLLLVNAGLIANGIQRGEDANPGFATHDVGVLTVELPGTFDTLRRAAFVNQFVRDGRTLPGTSVAFANAEPLGVGHGTSFRLPSDAATRVRTAGAFDVSPGFLDLIQLPIVAGRDLQPADGDAAILVNQALAKSLWPGENPLGQVIIDGVERRVVGVVKDARMYRLGSVDGAMFRPIARGALPKVLTRPSSPAVTQALTAIATRIEPRAVVHVDSIAGNIDRQLGGLRVVALLAGILGLIALVMAGVGVFGVFAYVVQQRTREIGIRTALGASWLDVSALVLRDSARSVLTGLGAGLLLSVGVARIISSELYGASPFDWRTLGALAGLLAVAGVAATFVPIRRATRVDPVVALRGD
jgi:predicted permease